MALETATHAHAHGSFENETLRRIEELLPVQVENSIETGCGKSTILFSNLSQHHKVFAVEDRSMEAQSSIRFFEDCPLTRRDRIELVLGPTQKTLPLYQNHAQYDVVLLDGPHGYPFPDLEYYFIYPHIRKGGILILDDLAIPTIARLGDFLAEDDMFELMAVVDATGLFRRTEVETFSPYGDSWWTQKYNVRRTSRQQGAEKIPVEDQITKLGLNRKLFR